MGHKSVRFRKLGHNLHDMALISSLSDLYSLASNMVKNKGVPTTRFY